MPCLIFGICLHLLAGTQHLRSSKQAGCPLPQMCTGGCGSNRQIKSPIICHAVAYCRHCIMRLSRPEVTGSVLLGGLQLWHHLLGAVQWAPMLCQGAVWRWRPTKHNCQVRPTLMTEMEAAYSLVVLASLRMTLHLVLILREGSCYVVTRVLLDLGRRCMVGAQLLCLHACVWAYPALGPLQAASCCPTSAGTTQTSPSFLPAALRACPASSTPAWSQTLASAQNLTSSSNSWKTCRPRSSMHLCMARAAASCQAGTAAGS
jgi:hypothetical protein